MVTKFDDLFLIKHIVPNQNDVELDYKITTTMKMTKKLKKILSMVVYM